jgi:hypothetical protein
MMVMSMRKIILPAVMIAALIITCFSLAIKITSQYKRQSNMLMGGAVHTMASIDNDTSESISDDADISRFQRPSSQALHLESESCK